MWPKVKALLFQNTSARQTVAKNTFWLAVSNFGGRLLRGFVVIYAARVLGVTEWGIFSYALAIATFFTVFSDLGISYVLVRDTTKQADPAGRIRLVSTALYLKLGLLFLGVILILFAAPHLKIIAADDSTIERAKVILPIIALIVIFDTLREFGFAFIRAIERMEVETLLYLTTNLGIAIFGFWFLAMGRTVQNFAWAYVAGTGLGMSFTFFALRRHFRGILGSFSAATARKVLATSWPFAVSGMLGIMLLNTDIFMIGLLRTTEEVGLYSADNRIIQLFYIIPAIFTVSVLPLFGRLARQDDKRLRSILERTLGTLFLIAIPAAAGGFLLRADIIGFVFGSSYLPGALAFGILMLTLLVDFPALILNNLLFAYDRQRKTVIYSLIGGVLNVFLNLLLLPYFGIVGCAIGTLLAQGISNVYLWRAARQELFFSIAPNLIKMVLSTAVMSGGVLILDQLGSPLFLTVGAGVLIYAAALGILREPLLKEARLILQPLASGGPKEHAADAG